MDIELLDFFRLEQEFHTSDFVIEEITKNNWHLLKSAEKITA